MVKKIIRFASVIVLIAALLSFFGWASIHLDKNKKAFGSISDTWLDFVRFPALVVGVYRELRAPTPHPTLLNVDPNFTEINKLTKDIYSLTSFWNLESRTWDIILRNLKDGTDHYKWNVLKDPRFRFNTKYTFDRAYPMHSLLMENRSLITYLKTSLILMRLDSASNVVWLNQEMAYHHTLELDHAGNLWVCAKAVGQDEKMANAVVNSDGVQMQFVDDYIVNVSTETGQILFKKSVAEILLENQEIGLLLGGSLTDPIHMNDIQPVLENTKFWSKGDLFLSIRNRSVILHYRPHDNKLIRVIRGPFLNQHDVDIVSDSQLTVFSNNNIHPFHKAQHRMEFEVLDVLDTLNNIDIYRYDYANDWFTSLYDDVIDQYEIKTRTEGLCETLDDGSMYIEAQNFGLRYIVDSSGCVYRNYMKLNNDYNALPTWTRLYTDINF